MMKIIEFLFTLKKSSLWGGIISQPSFPRFLIENVQEDQRGPSTGFIMPDTVFCTNWMNWPPPRPKEPLIACYSTTTSEPSHVALKARDGRHL